MGQFNTISSLSLLAVAIGLSSHTSADDYRAELILQQERVDVSGNGYDQKDRNTSLMGGYYFQAVDTANKPLAEAAFLGNHSFLSLSYEKSKSDSKLNGEPFYSSDSSVKSLGVGVYIPSTIIYLGAEHQKYSPDGDGFTWYTLGVVPVDGLLVYTNYFHEDGESSEANLGAKYVLPLQNEQAIGLMFNYYKGSDDLDDYYNLAADYYFNHRWSVGANIGTNGETLYGLRSRYFITEQFSVIGEMGRIKSDEYTTKDFSLGVSVRF